MATSGTAGKTGICLRIMPTAGRALPGDSFSQQFTYPWPPHQTPLPRNVRKLDRRGSGRLAIVEAQESAQALPAYDRSGPVEVGGRHDELAVQTLMVSLFVRVREVLVDRGA